MRSRSFRVERHSSYQRRKRGPNRKSYPHHRFLTELSWNASRQPGRSAPCRPVLALTSPRPGPARSSRPARTPPFFARRHTQKSGDPLFDSHKIGRRNTQKTAPGCSLCRAAPQNACCGLGDQPGTLPRVGGLNPNHSAESCVMAGFVRLFTLSEGDPARPRHPSYLYQGGLAYGNRQTLARRYEGVRDRNTHGRRRALHSTPRHPGRVALAGPAPA